MLKHKIRKSRKNILSLIESVKEDEDDARKENIPEYSDITKRGKKDKKKHQMIGKYCSDDNSNITLIDEGYNTEYISDNTEHKKKKEMTDGYTQTQNTVGQMQINYLVSKIVITITQ